MNSQFFTLSNGLKVIFIDTEAFPSLTTLLLLGAGSRYENEQNNGIAHFFEHMAFKGSKKYLTPQIIATTIEGLGGFNNAFTSKDHTGYYIKAANENFETMIDVLSDMIQNPLLLDEEIAKEKGVIVEELNMYEDTPMRKVGDLIEGLLYKGTPLGFDIGGTKETVVNFTRQTFTDYMQSLYHPNNAVLVVAGGLNKTRKMSETVKKYLAVVEEKFKDWKKGDPIKYEIVKDKQTRPEVLLRPKKTEQTHFVLGFRGYSLADPKKYPETLLAGILGGGMSSRLFMEVREKRGLCYYIYAGRELYNDVGNFVVHAGVTNSLEKSKEALSVILDEMHKVTKDGITQEELDRAKKIAKGQMLLSLEDSYNVGHFFGTKLLLENSVQTPQQIFSQLDKIKLEEVVEVAKEMFKPEKLNLAMIGPFDDQKEFEKVLKI